jgi:hypothetical protein
MRRGVLDPVDLAGEQSGGVGVGPSYSAEAGFALADVAQGIELT